MRSVFNRAGFTLVEMLVVIVIITILAAITIPVVFGVIARAKTARIGLEVTNLATAIESYKTQHGAYPPDFSTGVNPLAVINQHLKAKYRYRDGTVDLPVQGVNVSTMTPIAADPRTLDAREALYFWLRGFTSDPQRPMTGPLGAAEVIRDPFFEFNPTQLRDVDADGWPEYVPRDGREIPYYYFNSDNYALALVNPALSNANYVEPRPYVRISPPSIQDHFVEPKKFQIISAGQDGEFGELAEGGMVFPGGSAYPKAHRDNITNFSDGQALEDVEP